MSKDTIHILITENIKQRCHNSGLNISWICRQAITERLAKVEQSSNGGKQ